MEMVFQYQYGIQPNQESFSRLWLTDICVNTTTDVYIPYMLQVTILHYCIQGTFHRFVIDIQNVDIDLCGFGTGMPEHSLYYYVT